MVTIQPAQNQKQTNTGGLAKILKLKIGAKVKLTANLDIQDSLINGHTGNINHLEFTPGSGRKVYVNFSGERQWDI